VRMRLSRTLSSQDAQVGEAVDFEVLEDVKVEDRVVVRRGVVVLAIVAAVQPKRRLGRGRKPNVNIDSVRLASGNKVAPRAVKEGKGAGHQGAMTGAIVGHRTVSSRRRLNSVPLLHRQRQNRRNQGVVIHTSGGGRLGEILVLRERRIRVDFDDE